MFRFLPGSPAAEHLSVGNLPSLPQFGLFAKQIWANGLGSLDLLVFAPLGNGRMVAAGEHLRHI
jgi:hypothetical protein